MHAHPPPHGMHQPTRDAAAIWRQSQVPVVYRQGGSKPLMVKLPFSPDNRLWLKNDRQRRPKWDERFKCWQTPMAWFDDIIGRCLVRFGRVFVVQPFRASEKCAPACWNAKGFECECSCMGANHGSQDPGGGWHVVSDAFAMIWRERELACRLIERSGAGDQTP